MVGLRQDILEYVSLSFGQAAPVAEEKDLGRIIMELGSGEEDEGEGAEGEQVGQARSTRPTAASSSWPTRSSSTATTGAPRTSTSSPTAKPPRPRCGCASTATASSTSRCRRPPQRLVQRFKIMSKLDIARSASPRTARSASGPDGHHRAARGHHPDLGRQRGRGHAHPGREQAPARSRDGLLTRNLEEFKKIVSKPTHLPGGGPDRLGQDHHAALGLGFITPST